LPDHGLARVATTFDRRPGFGRSGPASSIPLNLVSFFASELVEGEQGEEKAGGIGDLPYIDAPVRVK